MKMRAAGGWLLLMVLLLSSALTSCSGIPRHKLDPTQWSRLQSEATIQFFCFVSPDATEAGDRRWFYGRERAVRRWPQDPIAIVKKRFQESLPLVHKKVENTCPGEIRTLKSSIGIAKMQALFRKGLVFEFETLEWSIGSRWLLYSVHASLYDLDQTETLWEGTCDVKLKRNLEEDDSFGFSELLKAMFTAAYYADMSEWQKDGYALFFSRRDEAANKCAQQLVTEIVGELYSNVGGTEG